MDAVEGVLEPAVSSQGRLNNSAGCLSEGWAMRLARVAGLGLSMHAVADWYREGDAVVDDVDGVDAGFAGVVAVEQHEELAVEAYDHL